MNIERMKELKKEKGYLNSDIARLSGVPLSTVNKIFSGATKAPRRATILAIESVLGGERSSKYQGASQVNYLYADDRPESLDALVLNEGAAAYNIDPMAAAAQAVLRNIFSKPQGEYTLDDYYALPDDKRMELIDGVFYDMATPSIPHQLISIQIGYQLMGHVERNHGKCKPILAPMDVQLDKDNKTMVEPDVIIACRPDLLIKNQCLYGAPDLLMEIMSPSTRKKDMTLKLYKYANAGVREYWIIDPKSRLVTVYDFENETQPTVYTFDDKIPVGIWNNEFSVDFKEVCRFADVTGQE